MKNFLEDGERVEADDGYKGEPHHVKTPTGFYSDEQLMMKATVCARHETCNKHMKQWGCLKHVFCHDIRRYSSVFWAVTVITQLTLKHGEPLFHVNYNDH